MDFNTYLGQELLTEAVWHGEHKTSAIFPAGRVLFNKNKVTPDHAASKEAGVWGDGDQHIRTYQSTDDHWDKKGNRTTKTKTFHVSGAGHYQDGAPHTTKIGAEEHFHHDQSLRNLPSGKLVGVSNYSNGKKVSHIGEDHSKTAAAFHVYK